MILPEIFIGVEGLSYSSKIEKNSSDMFSPLITFEHKFTLALFV